MKPSSKSRSAGIGICVCVCLCGCVGPHMKKELSPAFPTISLRWEEEEEEYH